MLDTAHPLAILDLPAGAVDILRALSEKPRTFDELLLMRREHLRKHTRPVFDAARDESFIYEYARDSVLFDLGRIAEYVVFCWGTVELETLHGRRDQVERAVSTVTRHLRYAGVTL
jgi:hypothetical protein